MANVIQHGGGNSIYAWRESMQGYEFIMFDYGTGAIDKYGTPQEDLRNIFNIESYRKRGNAPDGVYRGGGEGWGTRKIACRTYLTRFVSVNGDKVRVVEKKRPGFQEILTGGFEGAQENFAITDAGIFDPDFSGFIAQGFVPIDKDAYVGRYSSISKENILGIVVGEKGNLIKRGSWQLPQANGLEQLRVGDNVTIISYDVGEEQRDIAKEITFLSLPTWKEGVFFKVQNGEQLNANSVKRITTHLGTMSINGGVDLLNAIKRFKLRVGDTVVILYDTDVIKDSRVAIRGIITEAPSASNHGVFVMRNSANEIIAISMVQVKGFKIHNNKQKEARDHSASPLVILGSSKDIPEEQNPLFVFKKFKFFKDIPCETYKTDHFNVILMDYPLSMNRLKEEIRSQIDAAHIKEKKIVYYVNAGQEADIKFLLETLAVYIREKGYSGLKFYLAVSTFLSISIDKARQLLESAAGEYGNLFELYYTIIRMNNLDDESVDKFIEVVNSSFQRFDGVMCNVGASQDALAITPKFPKVLKIGAWLQIGEDFEFLERKGWKPPKELFADQRYGNDLTLLLGYGTSPSFTSQETGASPLIGSSDLTEEEPLIITRSMLHLKNRLVGFFGSGIPVLDCISHNDFAFWFEKLEGTHEICLLVVDSHQDNDLWYPGQKVEIGSWLGYLVVTKKVKNPWWLYERFDGDDWTGWYYESRVLRFKDLERLPVFEEPVGLTFCFDVFAKGRRVSRLEEDIQKEIESVITVLGQKVKNLFAVNFARSINDGLDTP
ncbi:MAG: hypothetical protein PHC54_07590, partial [Candidatus Omnitrophica bacterium]|nr:hypothetical protein [Candidatus Omnitrophota bacterium]